MTEPHTPTANPHSLGDFLAHAGLAACQESKLLSVWPLVLHEDAPLLGPKYVPLADASEAGTLRVEELDGGGDVPRVAALNEGAVAVLVLFGEEIAGALQNRTANASFLVGAHSRVVLDVSCVEAGRWSRRGAFHATREVVSSRLRHKMARRVSASRAIGGGFQADQGEVWEEVGHRLHFTATPSETSSYADYRASRRHDLDEVCRAFRPVERQVGFVASVGGEIVGLEAVGRTEVFARCFPSLLRSYAIDAIDAAQLRALEGKPATKPRYDAPEPFLHDLAELPGSVSPSLGLGDDLRVVSNRLEACALVAGSLVHATAFAAEA